MWLYERKHHQKRIIHICILHYAWNMKRGKTKQRKRKNEKKQIVERRKKTHSRKLNEDDGDGE